MGPLTLMSRLDSLRSSIHFFRPESSMRSRAFWHTTGSNSQVTILPKPFCLTPSAIHSVLMPMNVPVSTISCGLVVVTRLCRNSSTSTSAVMESNMRQCSGLGHSAVALWYSGCTTSPISLEWRRMRCSCFTERKRRLRTTSRIKPTAIEPRATSCALLPQ